LWFRYGKEYVLKGVSFKAEKGVTIIMGRNGSGKTTLLLNIIGILKPERGEIIVEGEKVKFDKKSLDELRKKVTLVFQNPDDQIIAPTVWQEVAFGAKNAGKDFKKLTKKALELCDLSEFERAPCSILSGGMKKLLTIASAIAMDPKIILLDEPTAGLDGISFKKLVNIIENLKDSGKVLIIATHDYDLARAVGDKFVFLNEGRVIYEGREIRKDIARKIGVRLGEAMEGKRTKDEVIGIIFSKLSPEGDEIFADIGCGTGSVSAFFARFVKKVYAIEESTEAFEIAKERLKDFKNVEVLRMNGLEFLTTHDCDLAFFGGTKNIERMLEVCKARRIVVNAARIEVAMNVMNKMKELGIFKEMMIVNISKSYELANATAFRSENPVFIIFGSRE
ncbi:MAG: ATP-binding cassette domain-containing protein, partial [Archaeoglobaceae archaeon]